MTGLIGGRWTAGNRLEPSRPNGRGRTTFLCFPPGSWRGIGAARARGRDTLPRGDGRMQGARASRQERGGAWPHPWRVAQQGAPHRRVRGWGVPVAESVLAPPGPIPNPVVTQRSAGEYWGGDPLGGEAAADAPHPQPGQGKPHGQEARTTRGGAAAARWAHNPKVGGSNPPPATRTRNMNAAEHTLLGRVLLYAITVTCPGSYPNNPSC